MAVARQERFLMRQRGAGVRDLGDDDFGFDLPGLPIAQAGQTPAGTATQRAKQTPRSRSSTSQRSSRRTTSARRPEKEFSVTAGGDQTTKIDEDGNVAKKRKVTPSRQHLKTPSSQPSAQQAETPTATVGSGSGKKRKKRKSIGQQSSRKKRATQQVPDEVVQDDAQVQSSGEIPTANGRDGDVGQVQATLDLQEPSLNQEADEDNAVMEHVAPKTTQRKRKSVTMPKKKTIRKSPLRVDMDGSEENRTVPVQVEVPTEMEVPVELEVPTEVEQPTEVDELMEVDVQPEHPMAAKDQEVIPEAKRRKRKSVTMPKKRPSNKDTRLDSETSEAPMAEIADTDDQQEPDPQQVRPRSKGLAIANASTSKAATSNRQTSEGAKRRGRPPKATQNAVTKSVVQQVGTHVREEFPLVTKRKPRSAKPREGVIPITIHRYIRSNTDTIPAGASRMLTSSTRSSAPNAIDVLNQVCGEIVQNSVDGMKQAEKQATEKREKAIARRKRAVIQLFGKGLESRFVETTLAVEKNNTLKARVRQVNKIRKGLRQDVINVRNERIGLDGQLYQLRGRHALAAKVAKEDEQITTLMAGVRRAVRKGRQIQEGDDDMASEGLEFALRKAQAYSATSHAQGLLEKMREMQGVLERAVAVA